VAYIAFSTRKRGGGKKKKREGRPKKKKKKKVRDPPLRSSHRLAVSFVRPTVNGQKKKKGKKEPWKKGEEVRGRGASTTLSRPLIARARRRGKKKKKKEKKAPERRDG